MVSYVIIEIHHFVKRGALMKLINITNSNPQLVKEQLAHTDAHMVSLYSLGRTTVLYTEAPTHHNIILLNKQRPIRDKEIDFVLTQLFEAAHDDPRIERLDGPDFVEFSLFLS